MNDRDYFSHLYDIASQLNREFSLQATLRKSLEKTAEILNVETGWIWLTEPNNKSVYLASSYNLPPALRDHPERLSGPCYCIAQYLSDDIDQATNISEIACTRLRDINTGTNDLKFHATIPINVNAEKVGLINLLSKETRKLNDKELTILNTISELVGAAIQRTRLQQYHGHGDRSSDTSMSEVLDRVLQPQLEDIISSLQNSDNGKRNISDAVSKIKQLHEQLTALRKETKKHAGKETNQKEILYPNLPLTNRELEVLNLVKKGFTNNEIGKQLFVTERTVKFHITAILSKLNAKTRTEAVDIGLTRGFLNS